MISAEEARAASNKINNTDITIKNIVEKLDAEIKKSMSEGGYYTTLQTKMNNYIKENVSEHLSEAGYSFHIWHDMMNDNGTINVEW